MGQHHLHPQPVSLHAFPTDPIFCWLCQALGLVYMALILSWLSAAVFKVSLGTWVHPQDPCLPQKARSIHLPALHTSLSFRVWVSWLAVPVELVPCAGDLEHSPSSQLPLGTGIWILRN